MILCFPLQSANIVKFFSTFPVAKHCFILRKSLICNTLKIKFVIYFNTFFFLKTRPSSRPSAPAFSFLRHSLHTVKCPQWRAGAWATAGFPRVQVSQPWSVVLVSFCGKNILSLAYFQLSMSWQLLHKTPEKRHSPFSCAGASYRLTLVCSLVTSTSAHSASPSPVSTGGFIVPRSALCPPQATMGSWREDLAYLFSSHSCFLLCVLTAVHFLLRTTSATSLIL